MYHRMLDICDVISFKFIILSHAVLQILATFMPQKKKKWKWKLHHINWLVHNKAKVIFYHHASLHAYYVYTWQYSQWHKKLLLSYTGQEETLITKLVSQLKGEQTQQPVTVSRDNLFVQWQNLDAMCWMDVVLIMLVSSPTLRPLIRLDPTHELVSTLLITLLKANRQAQVMV